MAQADLGTLIPTETSGTQLATLLRNWRDAVHTTHAGAARPAYAVAGTLWIDTSASPWLLKLYTGSVDSIIATVNETTGELELPIAPSGTLLGRTDAGTGPMEAIPFADLRTPLNDGPLLYQWSDADLTGATAFVVDFGREDFVAYRCVMVGISGQSAGGYSFLRCGNPDTNTIYSGASDYVERWIGYFSSPSIYGGGPSAQAYVNAFRPLSSGSSNVSEVTFSFKNSFWIASMRSSYLDNDGQDFIISRTVRYTGGSGTDNRRLMIGSSVPLAGVGAIRIYGVR